MTITSKIQNLIDGKTTIKFTQGNFTSPILGNVWEGRVVTLPHARAQRFIDNGFAVEHSGEIEAEKPAKKPSRSNKAIKKEKKAAAKAAKKEKSAVVKSDKKETKKIIAGQGVE